MVDAPASLDERRRHRRAIHIAGTREAVRQLQEASARELVEVVLLLGPRVQEAPHHIVACDAVVQQGRHESVSCRKNASAPFDHADAGGHIGALVDALLVLLEVDVGVL